jgi:glycosyltransferase involved in cell wall biosynthesis
MAKHDSLVSIIMPTYNRAAIISNSIRSVLQQSHQNFELIIVDDCSSDNTEEVVKKIKDSRIKYIRHPRNLGAASARNTAIENSTGQYIAFLDSDDAWLPEKLVNQLKCFEESDAEIGAVYTWLQAVDENGKVGRVRTPSQQDSLAENLLFANFVGTPSTVMVRSNYLRQAGGFDPLMPSFIADWDLWIRLAKLCNFRLIPEILVSYLDAGYDRLTSNPRSVVNGCLAVIKKHHEPIQFIRFCTNLGSFANEEKAQCLFDIGRRLMCNGGVTQNLEALKVGKQYLSAAFLINPVQPYFLLHWVATILGCNYVNFVSLENQIRTFISRNVLQRKRNLKLRASLKST